MSDIFDPMTLRQMLLWLKQLSHKDVYKINSITQECPDLMRSYYIAKKNPKNNQQPKKTKLKTNQPKKPHIIKAVRAMEDEWENINLIYIIEWEVGVLHYWKNKKPFGKLGWED